MQHRYFPSTDARLICFEMNDGNGERRRVEIPVHKDILAARSEFFDTAFSIEMREATTGEVVIPPETGFSAATVQAMLSFIYSGAIPPRLNHPTQIALFKAAHLYGVEGLMDVCVDQLHPTVTNCCDWMVLAEFYGCKKLTGKILDFIRVNKDKVKATWAWRQFLENAGKELKILCGYCLEETPLTKENCCNVLRFGIDYRNAELRNMALDFIRMNRKQVKATEGWRQLMEFSGQELKTQCGFLLGETPLTVENCCEMLQIGVNYEKDGMRKTALDFILANEALVRATKGWCQLMEESEKCVELKQIVSEVKRQSTENRK